jgi:hypothetical protein
VKICVQCYPGKSGETEPHVFYLGARRLLVVAVLDRWREAGHCYFEVTTGGARRFLLRSGPTSDSWELAAVYRAGAPRPRVRKPGKAPSARSS